MTEDYNIDRTPDILTTDEVAELLRVHRMTVEKYREDHGLPAHNISMGSERARWRYIRVDVLQWVRSRCSSHPLGRNTAA